MFCAFLTLDKKVLFLFYFIIFLDGALLSFCFSGHFRYLMSVANTVKWMIKASSFFLSSFFVFIFPLGCGARFFILFYFIFNVLLNVTLGTQTVPQKRTSSIFMECSSLLKILTVFNCPLWFHFYFLKSNIAEHQI